MIAEPEQLADAFVEAWNDHDPDALRLAMRRTGATCLDHGGLVDLAGRRIAVAESCTGGLVSAALTELRRADLRVLVVVDAGRRHRALDRRLGQRAPTVHGGRLRQRHQLAFDPDLHGVGHSQPHADLR